MKIGQLILTAGILSCLSISSLSLASPSDPGPKPRTLSDKGVRCVNALVPQRNVKLSNGLYLTEVQIRNISKSPTHPGFRAGGDITFNSSFVVRNITLYHNSQSHKLALQFPFEQLSIEELKAIDENGGSVKGIRRGANLAFPVNPKIRNLITAEFVWHYQHSIGEIPAQDPISDFVTYAEPHDAELTYFFDTRSYPANNEDEWTFDVTLNGAFRLCKMKLVREPDNNQTYFLSLPTAEFIGHNDDRISYEVYFPTGIEPKSHLINAITRELKRRKMPVSEIKKR